MSSDAYSNLPGGQRAILCSEAGSASDEGEVAAIGCFGQNSHPGELMIKKAQH